MEIILVMLSFVEVMIFSINLLILIIKLKKNHILFILLKNNKNILVNYGVLSRSCYKIIS